MTAQALGTEDRSLHHPLKGRSRSASADVISHQCFQLVVDVSGELLFERAAVHPLSMSSQMAKRGIRTRDEFQPNSQCQKPLRFGAGARSWTGSGLTSIQPSRMSAFALELETVSSFPVSMFRTVRNRTWFIEAPPTYSPFSC